MLDVSKNGIITLNRGDVFSLNVSVNAGSVLEPVIYPMEEGDKLYFALMEPKQPFERALIRKVFTMEDQDEEGNVLMNFSATDTEFLVPGKYYYTVKLFRNDGDLVDTIISKTQFIIID